MRAMPSSVTSCAWLAAQTAIACGALAAFALAPPSRGKMMIVSLAGESSATIAGWAAHGEVRIIGRGPLAGSLVVDGSAAALAGDALRHGGILLAAPSAECGDAA